MFSNMDRCDGECSDRYPDWASHFRRLGSLAAQMFRLVADRLARIDEEALEHPDDTVFTYLLTGFAKSRTERSLSLLRTFAKDDEKWVRNLAQELANDTVNLHYDLV